LQTNYTADPAWRVTAPNTCNGLITAANLNTNDAASIAN
jgi:hypothetical protein